MMPKKIFPILFCRFLALDSKQSCAGDVKTGELVWWALRFIAGQQQMGGDTKMFASFVFETVPESKV